MVEEALAYGFSQAAPLDIGSLELREDVREMCAADRCRQYGKNWVCPPACGELAALEAQLAGYGSGVLVQTTSTLEDAFDYETMEETGRLHQERMRGYAAQLREKYPDILVLGSGGCRLCDPCTYPDAPCRHPEQAFVSMEAFGLWVSDVCRKNALEYNYGPNTITYTGAYLFREME